MKNFTSIVSLCLALSLSSLPALAAKNLPIQGADVLDGKEVKIDAQGKKGVAVVFLSAECPCSNSHVKGLAKLAEDFPEFRFIAVHANSNEKPEQVKKYFTDAKLPFPVIEDAKGKIADQLKAIKTPHAFLLSSSGQVLFSGGMSNSENFARASKHYLRDALEDVQASKPVRLSEARTLGCAIARGGAAHH